jgi:hypothetical protein
MFFEKKFELSNSTKTKLKAERCELSPKSGQLKMQSADGKSYSL